MQQVPLSDSWARITPLGTGVGLLQGVTGEVFLGTGAPVAASVGIQLKENWVIPVDTAKFTHIWVRGRGVARFSG